MRFYCNYQNLTSLRDIKIDTNCHQLDCDNNQLVDLDGCPSHITWITCQNNFLTSLKGCPTTLEFLDCSYNKLSTLDYLPTTCQLLFADTNELTFLPDTEYPLLMSIYCGHNKLTDINLCNFPQLNHLECRNNKLTSITGMPITMHSLYCDHNFILFLKLPENLKTLICDRFILKDVNYNLSSVEIEDKILDGSTLVDIQYWHRKKILDNEDGIHHPTKTDWEDVETRWPRWLYSVNGPKYKEGKKKFMEQLDN